MEVVLTQGVEARSVQVCEAMSSYPAIAVTSVLLGKAQYPHCLSLSGSVTTGLTVSQNMKGVCPS